MALSCKTTQPLHNFSANVLSTNHIVMTKGIPLSAGKVLLIDDDSSHSNNLVNVLDGYDVVIAANGREGIELARTQKPDIIILDIVMSDMSGHEACDAIRKIEETQSTSILFYSSADSLEGRLKAYDFGGSDYICKTAPNEELLVKVKSLINAKKEYAEIKKEVQLSSSLLQGLQRESSEMYIISKFIQASQFCYDNQTLAKVLFNCLRKLNARGTLYFRREDLFISSNGKVPRLEADILKHDSKFGRIHSFGAKRVVYNWASVSMLVKDIGEKIDVLAHLMDAIETASRSISTHANLVTQIVRVENENRSLREQLVDATEKSKLGLKDQLIDSGLISAFDIQDEEDFNKIIEPYGNDLQSFFQSMDNNALKIRQLLGRSSQPPEELKEYFNEIEINKTLKSDDEDVLF
jgi:DNA-binding response OmpR family regulator